MIAEMLSVGAENAITARELATCFETSVRDITTAIERERRDGQPICASCGEKPGYYLAAGTEELQRYCNRLHRRAGEMYKTRAALLKTLDKMKRHDAEIEQQNVAAAPIKREGPRPFAGTDQRET